MPPRAARKSRRFAFGSRVVNSGFSFMGLADFRLPHGLDGWPSGRRRTPGMRVNLVTGSGGSNPPPSASLCGPPRAAYLGGMSPVQIRTPSNEGVAEWFKACANLLPAKAGE